MASETEAAGTRAQPKANEVAREGEPGEAAHKAALSRKVVAGERADDPVRQYLREMGGVPLLSREGEIAVAKRMEAGRAAMIAGLCESALTFRAIVLWRDELNEGRIRLRDIIDLERSRADPDTRTIRVPAHVIEAIGKLRRESRRMRSAIGREPSAAELAEKLHLPIDKVRKAQEIEKEPVSLESPVGDGEDAHLADFIEDENAVLPIDAAIRSDLCDATTRVLASLSAREERVLRMRFGIGTTSDHTLDEVGQQLAVSRERIRQIEARALRKLKHPARSMILRSFLE